MHPKNSEKIVAVDSQIVTFFVEAERNSKPVSAVLQNTYNAVYDIALTYGFWLLPKVEEEVQKIPDVAYRLKHEQSLIQLFRLTNLSEFASQIEARTKKLRMFHRDGNDCWILAEAEALQADVLLTFDEDFEKRLKSRTSVQLIKPSQFRIPVGTPHKFRREN